MTDWQHELDTQGLLCPEPIMLLHQKIREIAPGDVLRMLATDPATERDLIKFCGFLKHELIKQEQLEATYVFYIRKKAQ